MDIVIITTGTQSQEHYWQSYFDHLRTYATPSSPIMVILHEDWEGGAGNGLGSLYAYQKAHLKLLAQQGIDLIKEQQAGAAITLYHTAGLGTRLFPLTASEHQNKSAVKLPGSNGPQAVYSLLEAVIKQTANYNKSRPGRLAVFWGDQIFLPSNGYAYTPTHHVDILVKSLPFPSVESWSAQGLHHYGFTVYDQHRNALLIDKCSYPLITQIFNQTKQLYANFAQSLGCFSLSYPLTVALLELCQLELESKQNKWDSDPFFWMPTTLDYPTYLTFMRAKNYPVQQIQDHYQRLHNFKENFCQNFPELSYFGVVDIGSQSDWWDYGTLTNYFENVLKLKNRDAEGARMRDFFGLSLDEKGCCRINCTIEEADCQDSVLINVNAKKAHLKNCIVINSQLEAISAENSLIYQVQEGELLALSPLTVRADLIFNNQKIKLYRDLSPNPITPWDQRLPLNLYSHKELYDLTKEGNLDNKLNQQLENSIQ